MSLVEDARHSLAPEQSGQCAAVPVAQVDFLEPWPNLMLRHLDIGVNRIVRWLVLHLVHPRHQRIELLDAFHVIVGTLLDGHTVLVPFKILFVFFLIINSILVKFVIYLKRSYKSVLQFKSYQEIVSICRERHRRETRLVSGPSPSARPARRAATHSNSLRTARRPSWAKLLRVPTQTMDKSALTSSSILSLKT